MKFGLPLSVMAHAAFLGAGMIVIGGPQALDAPAVIPVKIYTVAEQTNVRAAQKRPDPKPQPQINEPAAAQTPPPSAAPGEPKVETPKTVASEEAAPVETAALDRPAEDTPQQTEGPKPLSLADLQNLVAGSKSETQSTEQQILQSERNRMESADEAREQVGLGTGLTTSYEDAIMRRVRRLWEIPAGAPDLESLIVVVDVQLDRDGRVTFVDLTPDSRRRARGNDYYTIAAENAVRAVRQAEQFKFLPRPQYEQWRSLKLTFRPQDLPATVPT